mmetsp:Transcript_12672/g.25868  ORF Transcript_12672/g.25868 Transcript_12672/m.25868 type:complete len:553 (-) Transcript_12672:387-2045(-)
MVGAAMGPMDDILVHSVMHQFGPSRFTNYFVLLLASSVLIPGSTLAATLATVVSSPSSASASILRVDSLAFSAAASTPNLEMRPFKISCMRRDGGRLLTATGALALALASAAILPAASSSTLGITPLFLTFFEVTSGAFCEVATWALSAAAFLEVSLFSAALIAACSAALALATRLRRMRLSFEEDTVSFFCLRSRVLLARDTRPLRIALSFEFDSATSSLIEVPTFTTSFVAFVLSEDFFAREAVSLATPALMALVSLPDELDSSSSSFLAALMRLLRISDIFEESLLRVREVSSAPSFFAAAILFFGTADTFESLVPGREAASASSFFAAAIRFLRTADISESLAPGREVLFTAAASCLFSMLRCTLLLKMFFSFDLLVAGFDSLATVAAAAVPSFSAFPAFLRANSSSMALTFAAASLAAFSATLAFFAASEAACSAILALAAAFLASTFSFAAFCAASSSLSCASCAAETRFLRISDIFDLLGDTEVSSALLSACFAFLAASCASSMAAFAFAWASDAALSAAIAFFEASRAAAFSAAAFLAASSSSA